MIQHLCDSCKCLITLPFSRVSVWYIMVTPGGVRPSTGMTDKELCSDCEDKIHRLMDEMGLE